MATADFYPGAGILTLNAAAGADCFVLKMTQDLSGIDQQPLTGQAPGIYIIELRDASFVSRTRVIKR